jgi:hypothetical protein
LNLPIEPAGRFSVGSFLSIIAYLDRANTAFAKLPMSVSRVDLLQQELG